MDKSMMCSRCKKRPAVVFISKINGDETTQEGLCLKCAMEMNIGPIKQMMEKMGITEDDVDAVSEQLGDAMESLGDSFDFGGAGTIPFMQNLGIVKGDSDVNTEALDEKTSEVDSQSEDKEGRKLFGRKKKQHNEKKRKFLNLYCTDLTKKARDGEIDRIIGRSDEIYRVTQILCRRTKNNP